MRANDMSPGDGHETGDSVDDQPTTTPITRRDVLRASATAAAVASISGVATASRSTLDGPHSTPGALPDAGEGERTLFQASAGSRARVTPRGGTTLVESPPGEPACDGGLRLWLLDADSDDPVPVLTVAAADDVVTATSHADLDAEALRELSDDLVSVELFEERRVDVVATSNRAEGGGARLRDSSDNGFVATGGDREGGVSLSINGGNSWARADLPASRVDDLRAALDDAADVIDAAD